MPSVPPPRVTGKEQLRYCQPVWHIHTLSVSQEHKHQFCLFYPKNQSPGFHTQKGGNASCHWFVTCTTAVPLQEVVKFLAKWLMNPYQQKFNV